MADDLDIYARAPGNNIPYIITISTFVTDGSVTVDFTRNKDNPQINGIEVFDDGAPIPAPTLAPRAVAPAAAPTTTFQDILINCGGTYTTTSNLVWMDICIMLKLNSYRIALIRLYQVRYIWSNLAYGLGVRTLISMVVVPTVSPT